MFDTLRIEDVGNPAWDPNLLYHTSEGFAYYFPALARLALAEPDYATRLVMALCYFFHLVGDGRRESAGLWLARPEQRPSHCSVFCGIWLRQEQHFADEHCKHR